jgi:hypothetical protein
MSRSTLHPLLVVLMVSAVCPARAAAQAIVIEVDNDARIPAADLAEMEEVVARSYVASNLPRDFEVSASVLVIR